MKYLNTVYVSIVLIGLSYNCQNSEQKAIDSFNTCYLSFHIKGLSASDVILEKIYGSNSIPIDTIKVSKRGRGTCKLNNPSVGLYRLLYGRTNLDIIISNEDSIVFNTFIVNSKDSMHIVHSDENKLFYDGLKRIKELDKKLSILSSLIENYPVTTKFAEQAHKEYQEVVGKHEKYIKNLKLKYPESLAVKYISSLQLCYPEKYTDRNEMIANVKKHFFDNVNFSDSLLLYTNIIPLKIDQYLGLHNLNVQHSTSDESQYNKLVDALMNKAAANDAVFDFVLNYLIGKFEENKAFETLAYINKQYVPLISCVNEDLRSKLSGKLDKFSGTSIGVLAPEFSIADVAGETVQSDKLNSRNVLLVFWATWCPHCTKLMPALHSYYRTFTRDNFEIIAVSLDTEKNKWLSFINEYNLDWVNVSELKGWNSKVAEKFNIYATPTMILLDSDRRIIAKPSTITELDQILKSRTSDTLTISN